MGALPQALCCGILGGPMSGEPPGHSPRKGAASQEAPSRCTKQAVPGEAMRGPRRKRQQCTQLAMNLQIRSWLGGFSSHLRLHQGGKGGSSSAKCSFHSTLAHSSSHAGLGGPGEQSRMCPSPEAGRRPCKAVSSSSRLWTQRGPWQSPCGALGPEVEPSKKNCFSPRISSPILQSAQVSPSFKRERMPTSVLLQEEVWSSSPGSLPVGAPLQDTDLGKSQGLSAWLPPPASARLREKREAHSPELY